MKQLTHLVKLTLCLSLLTLVGCAAQEKYDYSAFERSKPKSILVIPPSNASVEVNAPYIFLSTISRPLAERGYYVFPVAVIDQMLKENGMASTDEMQNIPLEKLNQHINPDAIMYVNIEEWGQKYQVLASTTTVRATMKMIDAKTADVIWEGSAIGQRSSGDSGGGLAGMLITAVIEQVAGNVMDYTPEVSAMANTLTLINPNTGLPNGPYLVGQPQ